MFETFGCFGCLDDDPEKKNIIYEEHFGTKEDNNCFRFFGSGTIWIAIRKNINFFRYRSVFIITVAVELWICFAQYFPPSNFTLIKKKSGRVSSTTKKKKRKFERKTTNLLPEFFVFDQVFCSFFGKS